MNINYVFSLDVPPEQAWEVLTDIPGLTPCMPGATLEGEDDKGYKGKMKVKLGPIDMVFNGHIRFLERDDEMQYALLEAAAAEMKGAGNAKANIKFHVRPQGEGSEVTVDSEYAVSGKAAQLGGGVIQSVGKRLMDEFAKRVRTLIAERSLATTSKPIEHEAPPAASGLAGSPAAHASHGDSNEALDLIGLSWRPILGRGVIAVVALFVIGYGVWRYLA